MAAMQNQSLLWLIRCAKLSKRVMNGQSYEVSFDGGYKHYNRNLYLADGAKKLRQNEIDK